MVKSFMKHLINEEIPPEMMELLRDLSIRFYDGCIIVQVYDHRTKKGDSTATEKTESTEKKDEKKTEGSLEGSPSKESELKAAPEPAVKPRKYRSLLRPTPQSLYFDLLYHTDSALTKFTDHFALQMESELLTLTNRNLDLTVPLNPYLQNDYLRPEHEFPKVIYDKEKKEDKLQHLHRKETPREIRKLHEEQLTLHKSSEYEELMLLLSSKYSTSLDVTSDKRLVVVGPTLSLSSDPVSLESTPLTSTGESKRPENTTSASIIPTSNISSNQFMRLRFIEEIRKRKESQKAQAGAAVASQTQNNFSSTQSRPGSGETNGVATPANRRTQTQPQPAIPAHREGAPLNTMNTQRMPTQPPQQPMNRLPAGSQPPQPHGQYNINMAPQAQMKSRQGVPIQGQRAQAAPRSGPMHQQHMLQPVSTASLPNYVGSPVAANARMQQPGIQRPMSLMLNQKNFPQGQMPRAQNPQMAKGANNIPRGNMQDRYMQQGDYDQSQAQANKRQKMQTAGTGQMQQNQFNMMGARPQQMPGNGLIGNSIQNGTMQGGRMANAGQLSSPQANQVKPVQSQVKPIPIQGQSGGPRPSTQPGAGRNGAPSSMQLQHNQIFQMVLSPQEQQLFRQMQTKASTLVQVGNSGFAPNGSRLTPEQQQRALQQSKALQQQMLQKFPAYFQKLRQLQMMQQQRQQQQQQQQQMQRQQMQMQQNQMNDGSMFSQQNSGLGMNLPSLSEQVISLPMISQLNNGMQQGPGN